MISENQRKKPGGDKFDCLNNVGNEQSAYYAPETSRFLRCYDYGMTLHLWCSFFTCVLKVDK